MAITTRIEYQLALGNLFIYLLENNSDMLRSLFPGIMEYSALGGDNTILANMLLSTWWRNYIGRTHNAHEFSHLLSEEGVEDVKVREIPFLREPTL